jgi:excisionase family DNA binding protein
MIQLNFDEDRLTAIVENAVTIALAEKKEVQTTEVRILHSIRELADFLGCSTVTAQKIKNEGRIPFMQVGRKVLFNTAEVTKAIERRRKEVRK